MRLVLTGGGTGGHIYPALALAEAFAREPAFAPLDVLFVGTRERMEADLVPQAGVPIAFVRAAPLGRRPSLGLLKTLAANAAGFVQALAILHRARPDLVIATGGYVSLPVVAALRCARLLRRSRARVALLEPNARSGLTNRLLAPLADEVWLGVVPLARELAAREHVVGTPVRAEFHRRGDRRGARVALGLAPELQTVAVFGGSQGARSLNEAVLDLAQAGVPPGVQVLLVTGTSAFEAARARGADVPRLHLRAYLADPAAAYAAADVVIARAGASTLAELAATATPAVLVPYPLATGDHQTHNARAYAASGAARVVPDAQLDAALLRTILADVLSAEQLARMRAAARAHADGDPCAEIVARVKRLTSANALAP